MRKCEEKKKKRDFFSAGPGGGFLAHPGASARASARAGALAAQLRPTCEGDGAGAGSDGVTAGPPVSESGGGGTALRSDGAGEPAERGRKAGRRWARRRFAAGGPVLGPRGGGLARAEAGDSRGRLNLARGGWEGAVRGEGAELRGGDRRRWALGEGLGRGSGALGSWLCDGAAWFT
jgi:hypothetical protein